MSSKTLDFIDLRLTRPPGSFPPRPGNGNINDKAVLSPIQNGRSAINDEPPSKVIERRADPGRRKREKEAATQEEVPPSKVMFNDMTPDALKRLHAMIQNFCRLEDGTFNKDINLRQYGQDSG